MPTADRDYSLYLVTGTSGTGVEESLSRWCAEHPEQPHFVRLESHLLKLAHEVLDPELTMNQLFALPEGVLRDLWIAAGQRTVEEALVNLKGRDVFLRLNACWYHGASGGFIAGVHIPTLIHLPKPKLVLTLIDDIYDTLIRLERPNKVFEVRSQEETLVSVLLKLLTWREMEVREAQQIALSFGAVRHVLFSVKHPTKTFEQLLKVPADRCAYLSHPISVVRREELSISNSSPLLEFIQKVASRLREEESLVLFEPTSIDEWLLERDESSGEIHDRELKTRWPLAVSSSGAPVAIFADPLSDIERARAEQPFVQTDESLQSLRILSNEIRNQIRWRDRLMVEQSAHLLVVRPFASTQGKISGGVLIEVGYHAELKQYFENTRLASELDNESGVMLADRRAPIVFHPDQDESARRVGAVIAVIEAAVSEQQVKQWPEGDEASRFTARLRHNLYEVGIHGWLGASDIDVTSHLEECFPAVDVGRKPYFVGRDRGGTLAGGTAATRDAACREIGRRIKEAIRGEWRQGLQYSMLPLEGCDLLTEQYDSATLLAEAMLSRIDLVR